MGQRAVGQNLCEQRHLIGRRHARRMADADDSVGGAFERRLAEPLAVEPGAFAQAGLVEIVADGIVDEGGDGDAVMQQAERDAEVPAEAEEAARAVDRIADPYGPSQDRRGGRLPRPEGIAGEEVG